MLLFRHDRSWFPDARVSIHYDCSLSNLFEKMWFTSSKLKLSTPLGGQTTMLGKWISDIGKVSVVVAIGFLAQNTKASLIANPAATQEAITTRTQNTLAGIPWLLAMCENPPIEDLSKKLQRMSRLKKIIQTTGCFVFTFTMSCGCPAYLLPGS